MTVGGAFAGGIVMSILNELSEHQWIVPVIIWCGSISFALGVIALLVNIIGLLAFDDIQFSVRPIWVMGGGIILVLFGVILSALAEYFSDTSINTVINKVALIGGVLGCGCALFLIKFNILS